MPRKDAAKSGHVCPGIRIQAIDIVQSPGIGISPIADMDAHQTLVPTALAAKSNAETPKKANWEARSETMGSEISRSPVTLMTLIIGLSFVVLVVPAPPDALVLITPLGGAVEPLVHSPEAI